jgi:hypothetical protein
MSWFSGLLAGSTGHPPSRGGLGRPERADRAAGEDAGARIIARAAQSARLVALDVVRRTRRTWKKLDLTPATRYASEKIARDCLDDR